MATSQSVMPGLAAAAASSAFAAPPGRRVGQVRDPGELAGEGHQLGRDRLSLTVIGVQQRLGGGAGQDGVELPGQVPGVLHPGVHTLSPGRTVRMGGIAGQEDRSGTELLGHPLLGTVGGSRRHHCVSTRATPRACPAHGDGPGIDV